MTTRCSLVRLTFATGLLGALAPALARATAPPPGADLTTLSLEQLMDLDVTTVSRKTTPRAESAGAVYVITAEDIRRAGVTTLADALRLAPGVHVARLDGNEYAVGIRGFGSRLTRGVLVLIDGRSVYTPFFAGTYWDMQETLLSDVERIEVVRGPGGATWGANAYNGVINIITRNARDTLGSEVRVEGGPTPYARVTARSGAVDGSVNYRVYGSFRGRGATQNPAGPDYDDSTMGLFGWRTDTGLGANDDLTVQGDGFLGLSGQLGATSNDPDAPLGLGDATLGGASALARWTHRFGASSDLSVQGDWTMTHRADLSNRERRHTVAVEAVHRLSPFGFDELTWGLGARASGEDFQSRADIGLRHPGFVARTFGLFFQEELRFLDERLRLIVGSKFEHNGYTGFEYQPTVRGLFMLTPEHTLWAAVSRAIRSPSRIDRDLVIDAVVDPATRTHARLTGDDDFVSEKVVAFELGHRARLDTRLYLDIAAFYNLYSDLTSIEPDGAPAPDPETGHVVVPLVIGNGVEGHGYGAEVALDVEPVSGLTFRATYAYLMLALDRAPGAEDAYDGATTSERGTPTHKAGLATTLALPHDLETTAWVRYVDEVRSEAVDAYVTLDARIGWRATATLRVDAIGQNLLSAHHWEAREGRSGTPAERTGYGRLTWTF